MAQLIEIPGSQPPANNGERLVVEAFVAGLPDSFRVYPGIQAVHRRQIDDIDVLVVTPECVVLVEVKDLAGEVIVGRNDFIVDDESRSHPYLSAALKARRLKSWLVSADPALRSLWVAALGVLARPPRRIDIDPSMREHVVTLASAIELLQDASRLGSDGRTPENLLTRVANQLEANARPRGRRRVLGGYRETEVLYEDVHETIARGENVLTAREVRLRIVKLSQYADTAETQTRRTQAMREAEVIQRLGNDPYIAGAREVFQTDDGSIVLVSDPPRGMTLTEAMAAGELDDRTRWRVLSSVVFALQHAHRNNIVHRRVSPALIEVPADGSLPRLGGFSYSKIDRPAPGGSPTIHPDDWSGVIEEGFVPPELSAAAREGAGAATDYWAVGALARYLWPESLPSEIVEVVPRLLSVDVTARAPAYQELFAAIRERIAPSPPPPPRFVVEAGAHLGEYVLQERIGGGASSEVWRAYEPLADAPCAVKIFNASGAEGLLGPEYRALLQARHDHVVDVKNAGTDGAPYLVMELLEGRTLAAELAAAPDGRLSLDVGTTVVRDVLDALDAIHPDVLRIAALTDAESLDDAERAELERLRATGIVHRDVKPDNVMITSRGAVLFDFGLASSDQGARPGGTAAYRPADASADSGDPDVDLFAIGVMLYEALTGRHPYAERTPTTDPPTDPRELEPSIPDAVAEVMMRACAPVRSKRYEAAEELRDDLDAALWAVGSEPDEERAGSELAEQRPPKTAAEQMAAFPREGTFEAALSPDDSEPPATTGEQPPARAVFEIGPVSVELVGTTEQLDLMTPSGGLGSSAVTQLYKVTLDGGGSLDLRFATAHTDAGFEAWVDCVGAHNVPARLQRLEHGLKLTAHSGEDDLWAELRLAQVTQGDWSSDFKATIEEIDSASGCDTADLLTSFGATDVGTRAEILGDTGPRRGYIAMKFATNRTEAAIAAYVLTRVLPLMAVAG